MHWTKFGGWNITFHKVFSLIPLGIIINLVLYIGLVTTSGDKTDIFLLESIYTESILDCTDIILLALKDTNITYSTILLVYFRPCVYYSTKGTN